MGGVIQIRCLGKLGRFGNQLFQYAFARAYASAVGATLETPDWIGRRLFYLDDAPLSKDQYSVPLDWVPKDGATNINLHGYYQHADCFKFYTLSDLRKWFVFRPEWINALSWCRTNFVTAHVRRGDYVTTHAGSFCTIGEVAYKKAAKANGYDDIAIHWVREDEPMKFNQPGYEFLADFFMLMYAPVLFRANSTFSWWAATLGQNRVFSPIVEGKRGPHDDVEFVEGNWPRCTDQPNVSNYLIEP